MIDFVGIGAKKTATSWITQCLREHPDICVAKGKEVHFFSIHFDRGTDWYESLFSLCQPESIKGEFSTSYLGNQLAPKRIKDYNPDIKLIVCIGDPVDRAASHLRHWQSKGVIPLGMSLLEAIKQYPKIHFIGEGLYAKHLARYIEVFSRDQIHVIVYEEIVRNKKEGIAAVYRFLGVDDTFTPHSLYKKRNVSAARLTKSYQVQNRLYLTLSKYSLGRLLIGFIKRIGLSEIIIDLRQRLLKNKKRSKLSSQERKIMYAYFEDEVNSLERMLGIDLSHWKVNT